MIVVPDIHGRDFWLEPVLNSIGMEEIIFLGDYLDPYPDEGISREAALKVFLGVIEVKKVSPDTVTLLLGNHDCEYIYGRDVCDCRCDYGHYDEIQKLFRKNKDLFTLAGEATVGGKRFVFTHAGLSREWLDLCLKGRWNKENVVELLNEKNRQALASGNPEHTPFAKALGLTDRYRRGSGDFGSPVWMDAHALLEGPKFSGVVQVVGHTQLEVDEPLLTPNIWFTDCRRALRIDQDGNLCLFDGTKCVKAPKAKKEGKLFDIDEFGQPFCCTCGSYDVYIRAGMVVDHWYCCKCGKDYIG